MKPRWVGLVVAVALGACGDDGGTRVRMDFARGSFYDAPFPSADLVGADGTVDVSDFPNPGAVDFVDDLLALVDGKATGFGTSSAIYFSLTGAIDESALQDVTGSLDASSPVFLIGTDPQAPDYLQRYPIRTGYHDDGGPFGAPHQLSLLPLQGVPLLPDTRYAAVVLRALGTAGGDLLEPVGELPELPDYAAAAAALSAAGIDLADVAGVAAFTTQDPTAELAAFVDHARGLPTPTPNTAFALIETYDDYCVYQTTVDMPVYQQGEPPFIMTGGGWPDSPEVQVTEEARLFVTIPRATPPVDGFPTAVMVRTGGGGDRPLIDRGVRESAGGEVPLPGTGPAMNFARVGYAGVEVDGPHGGIRNITEGDEQLLIFNITNPTAMRDNVRQSALELALLPDILAGVTIDVTDCPGTGGGTASLDLDNLALMGHSMGATIAPLVLANQPQYGATILSGAGGSWIENVVWKQSPFEIRPIAEAMLGYADLGRSIDAYDPAVNLLQWAGESADPPVYGRAIMTAPDATPRQVLMFQGIVDTYILPPIANSTSLSLGLDLAGEALDATSPELTQFDDVLDLLPFVGHGQIALPASGNVTGPGGGEVTAVVVQHLEDGIEDGHEVMFQTEEPKRQYEGFLSSWLTGLPTVIDPAQ